MTETFNTKTELLLRASRKPALELNFVKWTEALIEEGYTERQIQNVLADLWKVACAFVDYGFEIHPVQQARDNLDITQENPAIDGQNMIQCSLNQAIEKQMKEPANAHVQEER